MNRQQLQIIIFDQQGQLLVEDYTDRKTVSIGADRDADLYYKDLKDNFLYLHLSEDRCVVLYENTTTSETFSRSLEFGKMDEFGGLKIMVRPTHNREKLAPLTPASELNEFENIMTQVMNWGANPMESSESLRASLTTFLDICGESSRATNGMIVLRDDWGFDIVATLRLTSEQARNIWSSIPSHIFSEIEEKKARSVLPEGLAQKVSDETTIFVENVKSLAGFPILAEGKLIAILYLGFDNLIKSLSPTIQKSLEFACCLAGLIMQRGLLRNEVSQLKISKIEKQKWISELPTDRMMVGTSKKLAEVYRFIKRVAPVNISVLINGETGTGKELVAQEIHRMSDRSKEPFIAVNASALPEHLFESALFGHKRGAFTGAIADHKGFIEQANGGTLFIDEVAEIPLNLQPKLLRVLQEREIIRVGDTKIKEVDFRLVAATHCDLVKFVEEGKFREDLYYRIAASVVKIPNLAERRDDICELANFFKERFLTAHKMPKKYFSPSAISFLEKIEWPGNIRQLENVITRVCVMTEKSVIERKDIEPFVEGQYTATELSLFSENELKPLPLTEAKDQWLREYLTQSLRFHRGNKVKTAQSLGIGQRTLFRYIEQLDL